jgi:hypothetical protein
MRPLHYRLGMMQGTKRLLKEASTHTYDLHIRTNLSKNSKHKKHSNICIFQKKRNSFYCDLCMGCALNLLESDTPSYAQEPSNL